MPSRNKEPKPCRKCGGSEVVSKITANGTNSRFIHVIHRCKQCGEWLGGYTLKNNTKEAQNEQR